MKNNRLCLLVFFIYSLWGLMKLEAQTNGASSVSVVINFANAAPSCEINSKPVAFTNVLDVLARIIKETGHDRPVVVLVHEENSLAFVLNLRGIIDKVGFLRVRYFYFGSDRKKMAEISFEHPAVSFSLKPK